MRQLVLIEATSCKAELGPLLKRVLKGSRTAGVTFLLQSEVGVLVSMRSKRSASEVRTLAIQPMQVHVGIEKAYGKLSISNVDQTDCMALL